MGKLVEVAEHSGVTPSSDDLQESFDARAATMFPLALTPFEKFFFWDDRIEQPLTPTAELQFATRLNVAAFERAIAQTIARNPLLNSVVVGSDRDLRWKLCDEPIRLQFLTSNPPTVEGRLRPIDLRSEPGCRFWYEEQGEGSRVLWQLHHSTCDGIAMRAILIDVLLHYAMETDGSEAGRDALPQVDLSRPDLSRYRRALCCTRFDPLELEKRYHFGHLPAAKRSLTLWQRLKNAHYFHFQSPKPLRPTVATGSEGDESMLSDADSELLCHARLDRNFSERILAKCQADSVRMSEVSMALLFRTCAEWNRGLGDKNPKSRLRLMMPYDLRGRNDLKMPAANRLSFVFLGRKYDQCDDFGGLLKSVQEELAAIKETNLQLDLLHGLAAAARWPKLMRWGLRQSHSMATAVITYVGDVSRGMDRVFPDKDFTRPIGDAVLTNITAAPPVRRNTNIAIGLCINWGQINISAAWNRQVMNARDCQKFLELYETGWQRWCDEEE